MSKTFKIVGNDYEREMYDYTPAGFHLLYCPTDCSGLYKWNINPNMVDFEAAALVSKDAIIKAIHEAMKLKPAKRELSTKEKKAYKAWKEIAGDSPLVFDSPSPDQIADAAIEAVRKILRGKDESQT